MIELYNQNFIAAESHLNQAYQLNQNHRGIQKALGYTYTWLGKYEQAYELLGYLPEVKGELDVYTWWWTTKDRSDLAEKAASLYKQLNPSDVRK